MLRVWQRDGCNFYSCNQMGTGPRFSFSTPWQDKLNDANPRHKKQISVFQSEQSVNSSQVQKKKETLVKILVDDFVSKKVVLFLRLH